MLMQKKKNKYVSAYDVHSRLTSENIPPYYETTDFPAPWVFGAISVRCIFIAMTVCTHLRIYIVHGTEDEDAQWTVMHSYSRTNCEPHIYENRRDASFILRTHENYSSSTPRRSTWSAHQRQIVELTCSHSLTWCEVWASKMENVVCGDDSHWTNDYVDEWPHWIEVTHVVSSWLN